MKVHISPIGFQALEWDSEIRQYVEKSQPTFLTRLRDACHINSDTTLGDIFSAVERDRPLAAFMAAYSWCDVKAFHAEAKRPCLTPSDLHFIEISKHFEWGDGGDAGETISVSGISLDKDGTIIHWGIDFIPVNELVHLPVRLKPTIDIRKNMETVGEDNCTFSLLEVIGEIYWEISFFGSPDQRDDLARELQDAIREIDDGTAELIPIEDVLNS